MSVCAIVRGSRHNLVVRPVVKCFCIVRFRLGISVCHLLGDYLEAIKKDFKGAAEVYKKTCDNLDYGHSCSKFGSWQFVGKEEFDFAVCMLLRSRALLQLAAMFRLCKHSAHLQVSPITGVHCKMDFLDKELVSVCCYIQDRFQMNE